MRLFNTTLLAVLGSVALSAAPLPPQELLPSDTLAVFSIPDFQKAKSIYNELPQYGFWRDPAMKPFVEKLARNFDEDVLAPLEKQLGINFSNYFTLAKGQATFAIVSHPPGESGPSTPGFVLIVDSKDQADALKKRIDEIKTKWTESGNSLKPEKIRDLEFSTLNLGGSAISGALQKAFPGDTNSEDAKSDENKTDSSNKLQITFGQHESMFLAGTDSKDLEKILIRLSGGSVPPLSGNPDYAANHGTMFRDAMAFGWINFKPIFDNVLQALAANAPPQDPDNPLSVRPEAVFKALGIGNLRAIAFSFASDRAGTWGEIALSVPEAGQKGVFRMLAHERKESTPPPFVPADAVKFNRWRLDGKKLWATIEGIVKEISPQGAEGLNAMLGMIGKDKDPNFDLKANLIGNLGDDIITYQKAPRSSSLQDVSAPPSLVLVGSPDAEKLLSAFRSALDLLPLAMPGARVTDREFLGRKIYTVPIPQGGAMAEEDGDDKDKPAARAAHITQSRGYVAFSMDAALLEEFLRSGESTSAALRENSAMNEAAQKVGGLNTGFFGYDNQRATTRVAFELVKNAPALMEAFGQLPVPRIGDESIMEWVDFSLLPSYDAVAKYFHVMVYAGNVSNQGFNWKFYAPTAPDLK